jgi:hypothetical protein
VTRKWFVLAIGGSTALLLALGVAGYAQRTRRADMVTSTHSADDRLPRTLAELNAWYVEPPSGQNAAPIYLQGFAALQPGNGSKLPLLGGGKLPPPEVGLPAAEKSAATAFLKANCEALRFLTQGTKYEECRYPIDLTRGFEVALPHLPKLRRSALMLELSAVMHAEAQQGKEAVDDVLAALALGRSLEREPLLFSQSVRAAALSMGVAAWEQTLNRTAVSRDSLSELMNVFKKLEDCEARGEGFDRGLVAERATWTALLEDPQKLMQALSIPGVNLAPEDREQVFARLNSGVKLTTEQVKLNRIFAQLMDARRVSFPDRLKADELIQHEISEAANQRLVVLRAVLPAFAGQSAKEAESLARLRLGLAGVALEQFRKAHSVYPNDLSELVPEYLSKAVLDPFDGAAIQYRKDGSRFVLRSIRSTLKGTQDKRPDGDIVFAVGSRRAT